MLYGIRLSQSTQNQSDFYFMWLYILHDLANKLWMNDDEDRVQWYHCEAHLIMTPLNAIYVLMSSNEVQNLEF